MLLWKITGFNYKTRNKLATLYITASSFDQAIKTARKIDSDYSGGQVVKELNNA